MPNPSKNKKGKSNNVSWGQSLLRVETFLWTLESRSLFKMLNAKIGVKGPNTSALGNTTFTVQVLWRKYNLEVVFSITESELLTFDLTSASLQDFAEDLEQTFAEVVRVRINNV